MLVIVFAATSPWKLSRSSIERTAVPSEFVEFHQHIRWGCNNIFTIEINNIMPDACKSP